MSRFACFWQKSPERNPFVFRTYKRDCPQVLWNAHLRKTRGRGAPAQIVFSSGRLRWTLVGKCLAGGIPILLFSGPVGLRSHHVCHRMREPILHGAMWLLARAHALEPVGHICSSERSSMPIGGNCVSPGSKTYLEDRFLSIS